MPEETLCQGVASLTVSGEASYSKCNDISGKKTDDANTYLLDHVKYDFYKQGPDLLVVSVYVKDIVKESLQINFEVKALKLKFQTRSEEFRKLHNQVCGETIFEWSVNLKHEVDSRNCKYSITPSKLTVKLKRACVKDPWKSLEELNINGVRDDKTVSGTERLNGGAGSQVTENNINLKNTAENGDKILKQSNGNNANFLNKNRTHMSAKNSLAFDGVDVPHSLDDDADCTESESTGNAKNLRTKQTVNSNNNKGFKVKEAVNGLCDSSDDVLCDGNNAKESSSAKALDFDDIRKKDNVLENNTNLLLSYDAKKHTCRPGSAGLVNPANMCYINSIVQCLSSIIKLRKYLLSSKHSVHNNCDNNSGNKGLISAFCSLMKNLWSGKERIVSASKLKYILGKKHKPFMHYGQGDAQEFLTFLVDGLHEDLKEKEKEDHKEIKIDDSKDIVECSRMHWEKYINGNESIFTDLFQGQSFSEIRCTHCTKPSTRFDHWMQLNLSIPEDPKYLTICVFFLDVEKKPLKTKLKVCHRTTCSDLTTQLSHVVDVPARCLLLLRSQCGKICHIYDPTEEVSVTSKDDILIASEILVTKEDVSSGNMKEKNDKLCERSTAQNVDSQHSSQVLHISVIQRLTYRVTSKCSCCGVEKSNLNYCSKCLKVAYCNRDCQRNDWKHHRTCCNFLPLIIGTPFILSVDASKATLSNLKNMAFHYARYSVAPREGDLELNKCHLTLLENLTDVRSKGRNLTKKDSTSVVDENVCLALDWDTKRPDNKVISQDLVCDVHESVNQNYSKEDNSCSLKECLKLYWNPEDIKKDCGWRCDHCKDVRAATRKVMICKHPDNLVIHLKRFSYSGNGRKISKHIQFPLRGLDMSSFTHPRIPTDRAVYDLHAVCSHYGYMNFGHYIAYCKPYSEEELDTLALTSTDGWLKYDDTKVNRVKDSEVAETQAYILFYQQRKNATSSSEQTSSITPNGSEDAPDTDHGDFRSMRESVVTHLEAAADQDETFNNSNYVDNVVNEDGNNSQSTSDSSLVNGKILLEDVLD